MPLTTLGQRRHWRDVHVRLIQRQSGVELVYPGTDRRTQPQYARPRIPSSALLAVTQRRHGYVTLATPKPAAGKKEGGLRHCDRRARGRDAVRGCEPEQCGPPAGTVAEREQADPGARQCADGRDDLAREGRPNGPATRRRPERPVQRVRQPG